MTGLQVDGHAFIDPAIKKGAKAIICEKLPTDLQTEISYAQLKDVKNALPKICKNFFDDPTAQIKLVGITGTNGKTTVVSLLFDLFQKMGFKTGLISTIENRINEDIIPASHTTPDIISLYHLLRKMIENECEYAFMEVSSHAIDQNRIGGLRFEGGVFTNISHDHLDYHKTFKEYINVKKKFFDDLTPDSFALTNSDDKNGEVMVQNTQARIFRYGLHSLHDYKAKILENSIMGLHLVMDEVELHCRLIGDFNAYNLLAAYGVARNLGIDKMEALIQLSELTPAEGRFQLVRGKEGETVGVIDYAHTPDALEKILKTIQALKAKESKIITVVGCGGDRDKTKRPKMGKIAVMLSDQVVFTSDNPRSENADEIIENMSEDLERKEKDSVLIITDREQAIKTAVAVSKDGDIILIAGKGHEKYQEILGEKFPFDDKEKISKYLL
jgi:UDP-N-acetylmuramoyl-L-alanyl-D-glutamate--2,6-diaminopimelate ligase